MMIYFTRKRIVIWNAMCNSGIHGTSPYSDYKKGMIVDMPCIPQVGNYIFIDGKRYEVEKIYVDLNRIEEQKIFYKNKKDAEMMHPNPCVPVTVEYNAEFMYIDYYDYMKAFTHSEDGKKGDLNPTKLINEIAAKYKTVLPDTFEDWEKDLKILKEYDNLNDEEKIKLSYTRCKLI